MSSPVVDLAAAAAASAAEAQAKLELLAQPIRRKRKEPSAPTLTPTTSTPNNDNAGIAVPSPSSSSPIPYEHSLQLVNPAIQSLVQDEVLAIFFPTTKQHGQHLYRQLPGPQPFSIVRKDLNTWQTTNIGHVKNPTANERCYMSPIPVRRLIFSIVNFSSNN